MHRYFPFAIYALLRKKYFFKKYKVLGRCACLGNQVAQKCGLENGYINYQKSRVDFILDQKKQKDWTWNNLSLYIKRKDIKNIIDFQSLNFFNHEQPDIILMDSFSELTDQLFEHKKTKKRFCAHFSDLAVMQRSKNDLISHGLLQNYLIYKYYQKFFKKCCYKYPKVPIIFLHFPTKFEKRRRFVRRAQQISCIIKKLKKNFAIHEIEIRQKFVYKKSKKTKFPYHFSQSTIDLFANKVNKILNSLSQNTVK